jgi:hypothetical protein
MEVKHVQILKKQARTGRLSNFSGEILLVSSAQLMRATSGRRTREIRPVDFSETGDERPCRSWLCSVYGLLPNEIDAIIDEWVIPKSEIYNILGFSGDLTGCSCDDLQKFNWLWTVVAFSWSKYVESIAHSPDRHRHYVKRRR